MSKTRKTGVRQFFRNIDPKPAFKRWARRNLLRRHYAGFVTKGDICFDIGANIGDRVGIFLSLGGRVVAVEPQPHCVRELERQYGANPRVTVLPVAVGARSGTQDMFISDSSTISSMSPGWIEAVKKSKRFPGLSWDTKISVDVVTVDELVKRFGPPVFIKIDVEGFEEEVIKGISSPVKALSFEFTPEYADAAIRSIRHLGAVGPVELNFSPGETMSFINAEKWFSLEEMTEEISRLSKDRSMNGDIYVRALQS
jgi:FkbM family methyltransferase